MADERVEGASESAREYLTHWQGEQRGPQLEGCSQGEEGEKSVYREDFGGRDSQAGGQVFEGAGHQHESEEGAAASSAQGRRPAAATGTRRRQSVRWGL
jgi:hypothetical protein